MRWYWCITEELDEGTEMLKMGERHAPQPAPGTIRRKWRSHCQQKMGETWGLGRAALEPRATALERNLSLPVLPLEK